MFSICHMLAFCLANKADFHHKPGALSVRLQLVSQPTTLHNHIDF